MKLDKVTKRRLKRLLSPFVPRLARQERLRSVIGVAARSPTDWHIHFELAEHYFAIGRVIPAIAECRTSLAFGGQSPELYLLLARAYMVAGCAPLAKDMVNRGIVSVDDVNSLQKAYGTDREGLLRLSPDRYQRLKALATRVEQAVSDPHMRILDVGGGDGSLCLFMPHAQYVLAEPTVNGLRAQKTFSPEKSFDVVVACHVLEHIPDAEKENFLEELYLLAKHRVILLGPVEEDGDIGQIDELIYRLTKLGWAAEHFDCKLPTLDMLRGFATKRHLECKITPNGNRSATFWMVFASYYANIVGKEKQFSEVVKFSNKHLNENISNPNQPNDYFVEFYRGNS